MSTGVGSQGGFTAPQIPQSTARSQVGNGSSVAKSAKPVTKPAPAKPQTTAKPADAKPDTFVKEAEIKHSEVAKDIKKNVENARQGADSFQKSQTKGGDAKTQAKSLSDSVAKVKSDQDRKQQATEFAKKLNLQQGVLNNIRMPSTDKPKEQQQQQVAVQAYGDDVAEQKKSKKEKKVDAMLAQIKATGGERGQKFHRFIQKEMEKGPLSDSIIDLIGEFHATLKGDSLTASELLAQGEENFNLTRNMISADNAEEMALLQDAVASSISSSAGERSDLLALRNLDQNTERVAPPSPNQEIRQTPTEVAIEFVASINFGETLTPWDRALVAA